MKRAELSWCLGVGVLLALVTSLPFLFAYERQGADLRFTGSLLAVEDGNSYIAKMRLGANGEWLFRSPYTAMRQAGIPAFLPYLLLGKLAQGPGLHEQLVALLHTARILTIFLVVVATYRLASRFIDDERGRRWATVLAVAGGGLGWAILAFGRADWLGAQPLELYSPETFGFLAMLTFPHLLLARGLLLLGLDAYLGALQEARAPWRAAGWFGLMVLVQPLSIAAAGAAVGMHQILLMAGAAWRREKAILDWRALRRAATALGLPAMLVAGYGLLLRTDAFVRTWAEQNILTSPHPLHYLLAYGPLLPLAYVGAARMPEDRQSTGWLLVGWVIALPVLAYAPTVVQRRLPEGGWVALAILAALGWSRLQISERARWRLALAVMGLCLVSSVLVVAGAFHSAAAGRPPAYRPAEEVAAFEWLDANAGPGAVVLSAYVTGNALPAWVDVRVVIGHGPESAGLAGLRPRVDAFYRDSGATQASQGLLTEFGVQYVFVGPAERSLGFSGALAPASLRQVYAQGAYAILAVEGVNPAPSAAAGTVAAQLAQDVGIRGQR